jgi:uncharacterized membrane protein YidH (DUF202 family)
VPVRALGIWSRLAFGLLGAGVVAVCLFLARHSAAAARRGSVVNILELMVLLPIVAGGISLIMGALKGRMSVRETRFSRRAR